MGIAAKVLKEVADGKLTGRKLRTKADAVAAASGCSSKKADADSKPSKA